MVRKRIVTVLTLLDGILFRTKLFEADYRYTHSFVDTWSVDEVVVLDITRHGCRRPASDRNDFTRVVQRLARDCFVPLAAGGGIRNLDDVRSFMGIGADKVVINTAAINQPQFIEEIARQYGSQCVIVSIDARRGMNGGYETYTSWGQHPTGLHPAEWAREAQNRGAGEILITSIEKDGSLQGYDLQLCRAVSDAVSIPVLVCGGAGNWQHFVEGFEIGRASAVCTTCIYHFTESSIMSAKKYLTKTGIKVRP